MLFLEFQEVRLLSGDLLRQDALQRRQGSLAAGEVPEGALVGAGTEMERETGVMSRIMYAVRELDDGALRTLLHEHFRANTTYFMRAAAPLRDGAARDQRRQQLLVCCAPISRPAATGIPV